MKPQDTKPIDVPATVERSEAVIVHQPQQAVSLFRTDDPVEVVAKASAVASALRDVISKQGLISNIQGKQYPKCEAWTLCGTMLGVFPVLCWTRPLENGWEARVEARTRDGAIVGAAEAECLQSERNWGKRDDFALRSMAQTRATAKALRMPLGFIMTLAGYEATPSEEMPHPQQITPRQEYFPHEEGAEDLGPQKNLGASSGKDSRPSGKTSPTAAAASTFPTAKHRDRMLERLLEMFGDQARVKEYAVAAGIILETESLLDWPLRFCPVTPEQMDAMEKAVAWFFDGNQAEKPFINVEAPKTAQDASKAKKAKETPAKDENAANEPWRAFKVPFGKHKDKTLGEMDKKALYGFWAGFEVKPTFTGRDGNEVKKSAKALVADQLFRKMLDQAREHYKFDQKEAV